MIQIPVYETFCNMHKISKSKRLNLLAQNKTQHFRLSGLKLCNLKFYAWKNYVFTLRKLFTATDSKLKICDFESFYRIRLLTPQQTMVTESGTFVQTKCNGHCPEILTCDLTNS